MPVDRSAREQRLPWAWGTRPEDLATTWPCEDLAEAPRTPCRLVRAVDVAAPPEVTWAWICQLRRGPYSYDLVDNLGRRSPRDLDPAMLDVGAGDVVATIFEVAAVEPGRSLTLRVRRSGVFRRLGPMTSTYATHADGDGSRLVGVLVTRAGRSRLGRARDAALAWGDLVMMRRQLLTLATLAARTHAARDGGHGPRPAQPS